MGSNAQRDICLVRFFLMGCMFEAVCFLNVLDRMFGEVFLKYVGSYVEFCASGGVHSVFTWGHVGF